MNKELDAIHISQTMRMILRIVDKYIEETANTFLLDYEQVPCMGNFDLGDWKWAFKSKVSGQECKLIFRRNNRDPSDQEFGFEIRQQLGTAEPVPNISIRWWGIRPVVEYSIEDAQGRLVGLDLYPAFPVDFIRGLCAKIVDVYCTKLCLKSTVDNGWSMFTDVSGFDLCPFDQTDVDRYSSTGYVLCKPKQLIPKEMLEKHLAEVTCFPSETILTDNRYSYDCMVHTWQMLTHVIEKWFQEHSDQYSCKPDFSRPPTLKCICWKVTDLKSNRSGSLRLVRSDGFGDCVEYHITQFANRILHSNIVISDVGIAGDGRHDPVILVEDIKDIFAKITGVYYEKLGGFLEYDEGGWCNFKPVGKFIISPFDKDDVENYRRTGHVKHVFETIRGGREIKHAASTTLKFHKEDNTMNIKSLRYHDNATIVEWADGTKTSVNCRFGEQFDPELGFAMACLKKAFGGNRNAILKYIEPAVIARYVEQYSKFDGDLCNEISRLQEIQKHCKEKYNQARDIYNKQNTEFTIAQATGTKGVKKPVAPETAKSMPEYRDAELRIKAIKSILTKREEIAREKAAKRRKNNTPKKKKSNCGQCPYMTMLKEQTTAEPASPDPAPKRPGRPKKVNNDEKA